MANYLTTDTELTSIANAIRAKGGTADPLEFPDEFVQAIGAIPSGGGGGSVGKKQVNFIDYDGTILYSYTAAEAQALTALPENPSHTGLVAQGWNWTLAQIKSQLANVGGDVWVGQMYITSSGNTEIDVSMPEGRLSPILTICPNGTITVDWGDNTTPDTVTGTSETTREAVSHTYAQAGNYTITISVVSGSFSFYGAASSNASYLLLRKGTNNNENRVYAKCVQAIRLGSGVTSIGSYAFVFCHSLASVTIPDGVTSISGYAFSNCYSLASITIPDSVTSIENNVFFNCYSLTRVTIPDGVTSIGEYAFSSCYALASVTIPDSVTSIGSQAFYSCYSLTSITIPDSVTSIGTYAFYNCYILASVIIPDSVTSIENNVFSNCYSLASITIPDSVTSIGSQVFNYCYSLASITIPGGVTSIGNGAFNYCYALASVTIPDSVTSIGSQAFNYCSGMSEYHLLPSTPPTIANANTFYNIPSDCVIYVPQGSLEAYKTASRWSKYASQMQEEP